ncbi:SMI1/KNR4 family protein [Capnocytophaga sp.]|uniref:SMI1/KNR4 family protein n=1 Tax=Capnocytophaga sp. TaxID=44737 RepID=UPI0026DC21EE|nr:SMI1/KNR4 family protein [Capnocytophaga sp.]MDO5105243.1 SMI1/KNR4 family protein [Capnocytophaga sp.]
MNTNTIWQKIIAIIKDINPKAYQSLNPPATDAEIERLEREVGVPLPESFKAYLKVCNGQQHNDYEYLLLGYNAFLSVDEMIASRQLQLDLFADEEPIDHLAENKIKPVIWDKNWLPFANYEGSSMLILDFNAGKNGKNGQVFTHFPGADFEADEVVIADSFAEFSQKVLTSLQEKNYEILDDVIIMDFL